MGSGGVEVVRMGWGWLCVTLWVVCGDELVVVFVRVGVVGSVEVVWQVDILQLSFLGSCCSS